MSTIVIYANNERYTYGANADNAERRWMLRQHFTMYGRRCESFTDVALPESVTSRDEADAFLFALALVVGAL